jgi:hypothetical protein
MVGRAPCPEVETAGLLTTRCPSTYSAPLHDTPVQAEVRSAAFRSPDRRVKIRPPLLIDRQSPRRPLLRQKTELDDLSTPARAHQRRKPRALRRSHRVESVGTNARRQLLDLYHGVTGKSSLERPCKPRPDGAETLEQMFPPHDRLGLSRRGSTSPRPTCFASAWSTSASASG